MRKPSPASAEEGDVYVYSMYLSAAYPYAVRLLTCTNFSNSILFCSRNSEASYALVKAFELSEGGKLQVASDGNPKF